MTEGNEEETPPLLDEARLDRLRGLLASGDGLLLCLDFDGTLAPIVEAPADATLAAGNREPLRRLADQPNVTVAVVSGRSLADLRDRVDIEGIRYAGNHGLELTAGGDRQVIDAAREARPALDHALDQLREELSNVPGVHVEDKGLTATIHYRQVLSERTMGVVTAVHRVVEPIKGIECSDGRQIVEIRPDVAVGKDRVVERLRDDHRDHVPLFVGDDTTDEDGFRAVAGDGVGVLVGERADTAAAVRVPGPDGVTLLLSWLVQTCASPSTDLGTPHPEGTRRRGG